MVRLKETLLPQSVVVTLFQFHMVRLKVKPNFLDIRRKHLFQFHMVRLKEFVPAEYRNEYDISIPYGAIKSERGRCYLNITYIISIPYGAIKSHAAPCYQLLRS